MSLCESPENLSVEGELLDRLSLSDVVDDDDCRYLRLMDGKSTDNLMDKMVGKQLNALAMASMDEYLVNPTIENDSSECFGRLQSKPSAIRSPSASLITMSVSGASQSLSRRSMCKLFNCCEHCCNTH